MTKGTYEVFAVRYATRRTSKRECFLNFHIYNEPDADLVMDYFVWVVRNDERTVVVDTGFSPEIGARRLRTVLQDPVIGLRSVGVDAATVSQIVLTHAHYDHAGNLRRVQRPAKSSWRRESLNSGPDRLVPGPSSYITHRSRRHRPPGGSEARFAVVPGGRNPCSGSRH